MWGLLGKLLIGLAFSIISAALSYRKPEQTIEAEDEVGFPKAEEGSEIGKVFGTVWVKSPQVAWHGDLVSEAIVVKGPRRFGIVGPRSRTTVGYKYSVGVHFVPSLGPVDKLLDTKVQEKRAWRGNATGLPTSGTRIAINKPELFGGEKREGGIVGSFDFLSGYSTQGRNDYLQRVLGVDIPAFRGVTSIVLRRMYLGTSAYLKAWQFMLQRVFVGDGGADQWNSAKAGISRGIAFRNAAIYVAFDRSISMAGGRDASQRDAIKGFLQAVRNSRDPDNPNSIYLIGFGGVVGPSITRADATVADYDDLISWMDLNYLGDISATNYEAAMSEAPAFFATTGSKDRVIVFVTDGEPNTGSLPSAVATVAATGAECYGFNIDLADTTATAQLDNTPLDGVPVVIGGDSSSLVNAFARVFSLGYDMNAAHILREVLIARDTNGSGDAAEIGPSFATAADTLFAEGFGLSFFWANPSDKQTFIKEVESHIDGRIYQDRRTGLWELRLIRADYDADTLPLFDRSNVIEWGSDIEWPDPASLPNQITVVYSDPDRDEPASITLTNPARVQAIGRVINRKAEYRGINSSRIAARVAARDLDGSSSPLLSGTIRARFVDPSLNLGSPIKLHNPRLGIENVVGRIVELVDGDGRENDVTIKFVEDKFALPESELVEVEVIANTTLDPVASPVRLVEEAPYYFVATEAGQADVDAVLATTPGSGWLNMTGQQPSGASIEFYVWRQLNAGGYLEADNQIQFCPVSTLLSDMSARADHVNILVDADAIPGLTPGKLAKVGDEYVRIDAIEIPGIWTSGDYWAPPVTPSATVARLTVGRGCLDSSPALHAAGLPVIFWDGLSDSDNTVYQAGDVVDVKLQPATQTARLAISETPIDTVTLASRAIRPYPPGKVQIAGSYAAPDLWTGSLAVTWAHRDRTLQTTATFDDHTVGDIGPEPGTTYRVKVWPLDYTGATYGTALLDVGAIAGTSHSIDTATTPAPAGAWGMRVEVSTERDGYVSTRNRGVDVPVTIAPEMLPGGSWLDVNDLASVWQGADGAAAITANGQPIGLIENQRGVIL